MWQRIPDVFVNFMAREIALKIVYFGPRGAGVSTNLDRIQPRRAVPTRGLVLDMPGPSVPSFDLPIPEAKIGVREFRVRASFHERAPGALVRGPELDALVRWADGLVFIADSRAARVQDNLDCARLLTRCLTDVPPGRAGRAWALQLNRRDDAEAVPVRALTDAIALENAAVVEAVARDGQGVNETLVAVLQPLIVALRQMPPPP